MMETIKIRFLSIALLLSASSVYAMDWPSLSETLVSNFGWNDGGTPVLGVSFAGTGSVQAADDGEILFAQDSSNTASQLPEPLGTWIAVDHGDIISIYSRLDDRQSKELFNALPKSISKNTEIGISGRSGWTRFNGFHFSLFDRKDRRWVNPAMIMTPLPDTRSPLIRGLFLENSDGQLIDASQGRIAQGRYSIAVDVIDTLTSPSDTVLAPYRIVCILNGSEVGELTFETYSARDGVLMVYRNGLVPVSHVYAHDPFYEIGETFFTRGQITLEIIAYDISGFTQSAVYRFTVE
ncbi:MAG: M23 family metallopeptidase [Treponema sp.]|jgi:hypothetical protein|nr:M23 family metallopeptidase [Treponema sp.]